MQRFVSAIADFGRRAAATIVVAVALAGCASQSESLAPASAETPYVPNVAESAPPPPGVADYGLPPQADMPIDLPRPEVDPRRAYTLPELVDIAESNNPVTRAAWQRARQAALAVGVAESDLSAASQRPGPRRLPICVAGQSGRRDLLLGAAGGRCLLARRARGRVARSFRPGERNRAGRHTAVAAVRFRRPRRGDRERAAIVDRFRRRLQRRAPEADLRGRFDILPIHRGARASRDRRRDARQREVRLRRGAVARERGVATTIEVAQAKQQVAQAELGLVESQGFERDGYHRC